MLKNEGFGERGTINWEREVGRDARRVVFMGMGEEVVPLSLGQGSPCVH